jgi:hypothetical protein
MQRRINPAHLYADATEHKRWIDAEGKEGRDRWERAKKAQSNIYATIREEELGLRRRNLGVWFIMLALFVAALSLKSDATLPPHMTVATAIIRIREEVRWCLCGALVGYFGLFLGENAGTSIGTNDRVDLCSRRFVALVCILSAVLSGFTAGMCFVLQLSYQFRFLFCSLINSGIFWCLFSFAAYSA